MYGRNAQYKRESMAIMATITSIEATKSTLDDEASWPAWMSSSSLWLFPPSSRLFLAACCRGTCKCTEATLLALPQLFTDLPICSGDEGCWSNAVHWLQLPAD